jgi:hypothetical protein
LDPEPVQRSAPTSPQPALIIDACAGLLLDANSRGWTVWGLDSANAAPPLGLDSAMPALRRLREIGGSGGEPRTHEMLTFWTARGLVRLPCRVDWRKAHGVMTITVLEAELTRNATDAATPVRQAHNATAPATIGARVNGLYPKQAEAPPEVPLGAWLAHELRTPLSAVITYAEILKDEHFGPLANPRYQGYARDIYESARHALGVVDSMLRCQPAPSVMPPPAFACLEPAGVVEACLAVARPLAERAGLELGATYDPRLPRIVADELGLKQMLLNLLANAIKFARPGDRVTVAVACQETGRLTISVADTGPGMEAGAEPAPRPDAVGLGLGLPMTRALAAANGATLTIDSTPGQGTRAAITFAEDRIVPG